MMPITKTANTLDIMPVIKNTAHSKDKIINALQQFDDFINNLPTLILNTCRMEII